MAYGWTGTVHDFKESAREGTLLDEISRQFVRYYGRPTEQEIRAWESSIPVLLEVLGALHFDTLHIILELQMPVGAERSDVVLLGGDLNDHQGFVLELKQWTGVSLVQETMEVEVPWIGLHQHPSIQALNYAGKLSLFNSRGHQYTFHSAAFLHNASEDDKSEITNGVPSEWIRSAPVFGRMDSERLADRIRSSLLPCNLPSDEHSLFANAPYHQSQKLFSFLQDHALEIARDAEEALANSGMGLTEEQELIKNEVLRAVSTGDVRDFIIQGGPGSGKTLLAVSLLLKAAERHKSCILALRNNRLQAILRQVFDKAYPGVSGQMMYFEPRGGGGIARYDGRVELLICDEAQRMESRIMPTVLPKGKVSAILLDETQRLNPPEQGTISSFTQASINCRRSPVLRTLSASVRCAGGDLYQEWVERILASPSQTPSLPVTAQIWYENYEFGVCVSVDDLLSRLMEKRSTEDRVALVASFTESPGVPRNPTHPDNLRIGYPLTTGFDLYKDTKISIPWLMSTSEYRSFWLGGASNKLEKVASIYGAQGFESDYVGVIWGRDLLYREGRWVLGDPNHCFDRTDRLVAGRRGNHRWNSEALELLINRYRIFLTRGIKGTFVFCEDSPTLAQMLHLIGDRPD